MKVPIPRQEWDHHPAGQHEGFFFGIEPPREFDTPWGMKQKIGLKIESATSFREDGQPYIISIWDTLSNAQNANLRKHRELVLGRALNKEEATSGDFDPEQEFIGIRIGYVVAHQPKRDGDGISSFVDTFWKLEDQGEKPVSRQDRYSDGDEGSKGQKEVDRLFPDPAKKGQPAESTSNNNTSKGDIVNEAQRIERIVVGDDSNQVLRIRMRNIQANTLESASIEEIRAYIDALKAMAPDGTDFTQLDEIPF